MQVNDHREETQISPRASRLRFLDPRFLTSFLSKANANRGLERYRRASITASTSFLSKALTTLIGLISVPLTVHYLGAERYGVWLTISSLLTWMALTDFGLAGNALINAICEADGSDDRQMAREYSASAFWALCAISLVFSLAFYVSFDHIPWRMMFQVSSGMNTDELNIACALTLIIFVFNLPLNMVNSVYSAYQDGFVANVWAIVSNVLALIGLVVTTRFHGGLPALILGTSGVRLAVTLASMIYMFAGRYRWLLPAFSAVRWSRIVHLFSLGSKYLVTQLASLGIYQSQPFIITQVLGPSQVPIFVIAYKIIAVPVDLAYIATNPLLSAFGEARTRGDWRWIRSAFQKTTLICIGIGLPFTLAIALCGKVLVRMLAGPNLIPDWSVIGWLCVYSLVSVALMTTGPIMCGLEYVGRLALSLVLCSLGIVGLGILFAEPWGLAGVAAAMAVSKILAFLPIQTYQTLKIMKMAKANIRESELEGVAA